MSMGAGPLAVAEMFPPIVSELEKVDGESAPPDIDLILRECYRDFLFCFKEWERSEGEIPRPAKPGERLLALLLSLRMGLTVERRSALEVLHQQALDPREGAEVATGRPDILVCYRSGTEAGGDDSGGGGEAKDACVLLEVGFDNDLPHTFWKKVHQKRQHELVLPTGINTVRFKSKPMLLVTLTIQKSEDFRFVAGRLSVFLVTPKGNGDRHGSRVCLLTRSNATKLDDLSDAFGQVLRAALAMPCLAPETVDFEYLGPDCCRMGDEVRRREHSCFQPNASSELFAARTHSQGLYVCWGGFPFPSWRRCYDRTTPASVRRSAVLMCTSHQSG
jgi:hypothetical protein